MSAVALRLTGAFLLAVAAPAAASDSMQAPADSNTAAEDRGAPAAKPSKAERDDGDKKICRRVPETGTMVGHKRVCKPRSAWEAGQG